MRAFARHQFWLSRPIGEDSDVTQRAHLEQVERQTGRRPAALDGPELPDCAEHLWSWFCQLSARRAGSGFGPGPITYEALDAWMRRTRILASPWEVEALIELDNDYLKQAAQSSKKKEKG